MITNPNPLSPLGMSIVFGPTPLASIAFVPEDATAWDSIDSANPYINLGVGAGITPNRPTGMTLSGALIANGSTTLPKRGLFVLGAGDPLRGIPQAIYIGISGGERRETIFTRLAKHRIKLTGTHAGSDFPASSVGGVSHPSAWQDYAISRYKWHAKSGVPDTCQDVKIMVMDFTDGGAIKADLEAARKEILSDPNMLKGIIDLLWGGEFDLSTIDPVLLNAGKSRSRPPKSKSQQSSAVELVPILSAIKRATHIVPSHTPAVSPAPACSGNHLDMRIILGPRSLASIASIPHDPTPWDSIESPNPYVNLGAGKGVTPNRMKGISLKSAMVSKDSVSLPQAGLYILGAGDLKKGIPQALYVGISGGDGGETVFSRLTKHRVKLTGSHVGSGFPATSYGGVHHPKAWRDYAIRRYKWHKVNNVDDVCDDVLFMVLGVGNGSASKSVLEFIEHKICHEPGVLDAIKNALWGEDSCEPAFLTTSTAQGTRPPGGVDLVIGGQTFSF